ncbi:MAG: hypothetical protein QOE27_2740 [Solirubrobacteraceae bacterium]|nr:hypothetical protein [Solirubrobacteraceae bacterium]
MGSGGSGAECGRVSAAGREATHDYSRGLSARPGRRGRRSRLSGALLLSGLIGGVLLIAADLSTLYEVRILTVTKLSVAGHAQHSYALAVVGAAVLGMTAAAAGGSRPGMLAVGLLGLLGLVVAGIAGDFGDVRSTGVIGRLYENASAAPGRGFYLETLGGILAMVSGVGQLLLPRPAPVRSRGEGDPGAGARRRPRTTQAEPAARDPRAAEPSAAVPRAAEPRAATPGEPDPPGEDAAWF